MHLSSINLPRWVRPRRSLLHNCIWGWGCLGLWPIYATTPITDRGEPAFALLNIAEYRRLTQPRKNMVELLQMPEADDFDIEPIRIDAQDLDA